MWLLTTFLGGFQVVFWFNRRVAAIWMFLSRWWLMFSRDALETPDPMPSQFVILAASLLNVLKLNAFCISFGWWCVVLSSSCSTMCLVFKFRKNIIYIYMYIKAHKSRLCSCLFLSFEQSMLLNVSYCVARIHRVVGWQVGWWQIASFNTYARACVCVCVCP